MTTGDALRRAVGAWPRRALLGLTMLLGALAAVALPALSPPDERTFLATAAAAQSLMSLTLPFLGVLLTADLRRPGSDLPLRPTLQAAALLGVGIGFFGAVICTLATALVASTAPMGGWAGAAGAAVGGIVMQVVAVFVGTGFGLLIRPPWLAMLATVVLPLGAWFLLGRVDALQPIREWTTPFAAVQHLFSGRLSALNLGQWALTAAIWAVLPNLFGARRLAAARRRWVSPPPPPGAA